MDVPLRQREGVFQPFNNLLCNPLDVGTDHSGHECAFAFQSNHDHQWSLIQCFGDPTGCVAGGGDGDDESHDNEICSIGGDLKKGCYVASLVPMHKQKSKDGGTVAVLLDASDRSCIALVRVGAAADEAGRLQLHNTGERILCVDVLNREQLDAIWIAIGSASKVEVVQYLMHTGEIMSLAEVTPQRAGMRATSCVWDPDTQHLVVVWNRTELALYHMQEHYCLELVNNHILPGISGDIRLIKPLGQGSYCCAVGQRTPIQSHIDQLQKRQQMETVTLSKTTRSIFTGGTGSLVLSELFSTEQRVVGASMVENVSMDSQSCGGITADASLLHAEPAQQQFANVNGSSSALFFVKFSRERVQVTDEFPVDTVTDPDLLSVCAMSTGLALLIGSRMSKGIECLIFSDTEDSEWPLNLQQHERHVIDVRDTEHRTLGASVRSSTSGLSVHVLTGERESSVASFMTFGPSKANMFHNLRLTRHEVKLSVHGMQESSQSSANAVRTTIPQTTESSDMLSQLMHMMQSMQSTIVARLDSLENGLKHVNERLDRIEKHDPK